MRDSGGTRGLGAILIAAATALFANHAGMPTWQITAVVVLISVGLPALVTGRWSGW